MWSLWTMSTYRCTSSMATMMRATAFTSEFGDGGLHIPPGNSERLFQSEHYWKWTAVATGAIRLAIFGPPRHSSTVMRHWQLSMYTATCFAESICLLRSVDSWYDCSQIWLHCSPAVWTYTLYVMCLQWLHMSQVRSCFPVVNMLIHVMNMVASSR